MIEVQTGRRKTPKSDDVIYHIGKLIDDLHSELIKYDGYLSGEMTDIFQLERFYKEFCTTNEDGGIECAALKKLENMNKHVSNMASSLV